MLSIALVVLLGLGPGFPELQEETDPWKAVAEAIAAMKAQPAPEGLPALCERIARTPDPESEPARRNWAQLLFDWAETVRMQFQRPELARPHYARARDLFSALGDADALASARLGLADSLQHLGADEQALLELEPAAAHFRSTGNSRLLVATLRLIAGSFNATGRSTDALPRLEEAERLALELDDAPLLARVLVDRAESAQSQFRFEEALEAIERAIVIFKESPAPLDQLSAATAQRVRATVLLNLGRPAEAVPGLEEARITLQEAGAFSFLAQSLNTLGIVYKDLGRYDRALEIYDEAERVDRAYGITQSIGIVSANRAQVHQMLGHFREAARDFERAERIFSQYGPRFSLARIQVNLATFYRLLGRYEAAERKLEAAISALAEMQDPWNLHHARFERALLAATDRRYEATLEELDAIEPFFQQIGDGRRVASIWTVRGMALGGLDRHEEALAAFAQAKSAHEQMQDDFGIAALHIRRAIVLIQLDRTEEAFAAVDEAEKWYATIDDRPTRSMLHLLRGRAYLMADQSREGLEQYRRSAELLSENMSTGIQPLGESFSLSYRTSSSTIVGEALGCLHGLEPLPDEAIETAYDILQVFHGLGVTEASAPTAVPPKARVPEPLREALTGAMAALDKARRYRANLLYRSAPQGFEERRLHRERLASASEEVTRLERELEEVREQIRAASPTSPVFPKPAPLAEVRRSLPAGTALIELVTSFDWVHAFVVTRDSAKYVSIGAEEVVAELVQKVGQRIEREDESALREALDELGQRVLEPALAVLPPKGTIRSLVIAPDGDLCRVPFEALRISTEDRTVFAIEKYDVTYCHSGTSLVRTRRPSDSVPRREPYLLAFGDPAYPLARDEDPLATPLRAHALERLPETAAEVISIASHFAETEPEREALRSLGLDERPTAQARGRRFAVFLGQDATESHLAREIAQSRCTIVHLACHGMADLTSPSLSCIFLAPESGAANDGVITLSELRDLDLEVELVTLSACQTNAGVLQPFEGIAGLSRAALAAGARSVLSTLWSVRDRASRELMETFYREWLTEDQPMARAHARAKRAAILEGVPVSRWAAFTLWGGSLE